MLLRQKGTPKCQNWSNSYQEQKKMGTLKSCLLALSPMSLTLTGASLKNNNNKKLLLPFGAGSERKQIISPQQRNSLLCSSHLPQTIAAFATQSLRRAPTVHQFFHEHSSSIWESILWLLAKMKVLNTPVHHKISSRQALLGQKRDSLSICFSLTTLNIWPGNWTRIMSDLREHIPEVFTRPEKNLTLTKGTTAVAKTNIITNLRASETPPTLQFFFF